MTVVAEHKVEAMVDVGVGEQLVIRAVNQPGRRLEQHDGVCEARVCHQVHGDARELRHILHGRRGSRALFWRAPSKKGQVPGHGENDEEEDAHQHNVEDVQHHQHNLEEHLAK